MSRSDALLLIASTSHLIRDNTFKRKRIAFGLLCLALSACASHIYHKDPIGSDGEAISVDAKQRFLITTRAENRLRKVCLEPSPDVFSVLSAAFEGSAKYMDKASADLKAAFAEAGATIGTRTETVQLLRDSMYRICELALNGDLEPDLAGHLHEQYQKSMVTLAAVASLADASRPSQVALAGRSTITRGALMAELSKQIEDEKKVQEEKADASKAAEAAAKSDVGTVCVRKVSESSCVKGAQDCKDDSQGVALCDVKIQNEAATTNDEKLVRTKEYCSAEANSGVAECGTIRKSTSAHETLANSKAAVLQLEKELKEAKSNSDLSAVTQVVTLAPTTVQPRRENIEQIAKVVKCLVTQVYADTHVGYCLRLMSQREGTLQKVAQLNTSIYTLAAKRKISAEVLQSMFTTAGSSVTGPIGGVPNINGKATTEPELNSLFGQMYVKGYEVQKLNDLIEKSCENLSYSLAGKCE